MTAARHLLTRPPTPSTTAAPRSVCPRPPSTRWRRPLLCARGEGHQLGTLSSAGTKPCHAGRDQ
eukprot:229903-Chlamydomonas_euryale.AAC.1